MRRILTPLPILAVLGLAIVLPGLTPGNCFALGHTIYYSKTTTRTVTCGRPPAAPVAPAYAPVMPTYAPAAPAYAPVMPTYAPAAPAYAPVMPTYAPAAPAYAPVMPTYAPAYYPPAVSAPSQPAPAYAPIAPSAPAAPTPQASGQR